MNRRRRGDRLYRAFLRLFPREFHGDFAEAMTADFRDERAAAAVHGPGALARVWVRTIPALVIEAARAWRDDFVTDARFALRAMQRSPGFTAAAILMLAIGTGANAAMFSVIDTVLLRSPFPEPDRLVVVEEMVGPNHATVSAGIPPSHLERISAVPIFAATAAYSFGTATLQGAGEPRRETFECVTAPMFTVLETAPLLGRVLTADDDRPGSSPVVVISYAMWQQAFGGDGSVVGRQVTLGGTPATIVGVMPPRFLGVRTRNATEMWAPLGPAMQGTSPIGCEAGLFLNVYARVRKDVPMAAALAQAAASGVVSDLPDGTGNLGATLRLETVDEETFGDLRPELAALAGAVACVLLIACANVANLQLERMIGRRRELGLRLTLGASRGRIVRQTLTENLLLGAMGAALGLVLSWMTIPVVAQLVPSNLPHAQDIGIAWRVLFLTFAGVVAMSTALGLVPAIHAASQQPLEHVRATKTAGTGGEWARRALVVTEIALAMALTIAAGLTAQTFRVLAPTHVGFNPARKTIAQISADSGSGPSDANREFFERVMDRLRIIPGVQSVSGSTYVRMEGVVTGLASADTGSTKIRVFTSRITWDYTRDLEIPILQGRAFKTDDRMGAPSVAIVNQEAAGRLWPAGSPVGRLLTLTMLGTQTPPIERRIVGVAANTRGNSGTRADPEVYVPYLQDPVPWMYVVVTESPSGVRNLPHAIRDAVQAERPGQVVDSISSFDSLVDRSVASWRFGAWLFGAFGVIAVALASLGLAAVVAWWVAQRGREIGVRMALGASVSDVTRLILRKGLLQAATGVLLGLGLAAATTRFIGGWLYGVTPLDPRTFMAGAAGMLVIAALASYLPARRAARIDPIVTLKSE